MQLLELGPSSSVSLAICSDSSASFAAYAAVLSLRSASFASPLGELRVSLGQRRLENAIRVEMSRPSASSPAATAALAHDQIRPSIPLVIRMGA
jgi:hypothetical protein